MCNSVALRDCGQRATSPECSDEILGVFRLGGKVAPSTKRKDADDSPGSLYGTADQGDEEEDEDEFDD